MMGYRDLINYIWELVISRMYVWDIEFLRHKEIDATYENMNFSQIRGYVSRRLI